MDFRRVAEVALASLESLLREWLPHGRREGHEYKAINPTRADSREGSFSINLNSGAWADFATDDKGGDAISLYAYLQRISQLEAARALEAKFGLAAASFGAPAAARDTAPGAELSDAAGGLRESRSRTSWEPILPVPDHAAELPKAHVKRRFPETVWEYRDREGRLLGAVYRFRTSSGGKEILPCVWAKHRDTGAQEWRWMAFPDPRPLYGLQHLRDDGPVLVVEGEKCADAARSMVAKSWSVVTWPSGSKAVSKADWTPLRGRKVVVWPDCDAQVDKQGEILPEARQPGVRAAEDIAARLRDLECEVRIVKIPAPGAKPGGWDVADAIAEGWTAKDVRDYVVGDNLRRASFAVVDGFRPADDQAAPGDQDWKRELARDGRGQLVAGVPNAFLMLSNRAEWRGVLAFDEFAQRPLKRRPPPFERGVAGDWNAMDDSFTAFWLATRAGMPKISSAQAAEAAEMAAQAAPFDPVRGFLEELRWDGQVRLDAWLADYFGAPNTRYTQLVGRFWLIGMVKRAFEPGCKFDYMPILEGPQGRGKSTAMAILAGTAHFGNTDFVMGDKDSMALMQGKWLYEIAELDSFNKADTTRVKSFVTRQIDEFRPAYGRRILKIPRRVLLVGTTNQYEYFKDATGNRRFWPVKVIDQINLDGLQEARAQLFAEAVQRYRDGERCYPSREEQEKHFTPEQDAREIADAWDDAIHRWLNTPHEIDGLPNNVSSFDVLSRGLHLDAGKITREMSTRVGMSMRKLGWVKKERRGEHPRYVYERPKKSAHDTGQPQAGEEGGVPF